MKDAVVSSVHSHKRPRLGKILLHENAHYRHPVTAIYMIRSGVRTFLDDNNLSSNVELFILICTSGNGFFDPFYGPKITSLGRGCGRLADPLAAGYTMTLLFGPKTWPG